MSSFKINWRGKQVTDEMRDAAAWSINETMNDCLKHFKRASGHPGWNNITFNAQNSVKITKNAGRNDLVGEWGSTGVNYFMYLEKNHGNALQNTADLIYPRLVDHYRNRL